MFPTDHAAHYTQPFNVLGNDARALMCEADVILALDWLAEACGPPGEPVESFPVLTRLHDWQVIDDRVYAHFDSLRVAGFRYPIDNIYKMTKQEAKELARQS